MTTLRELVYMIEANAKGLDKAIPALTRTGAAVDKLAKTVDQLARKFEKESSSMGSAATKQARDVSRSADAQKAALEKQKAAMKSARVEVDKLNAAIKGAGGDSRLLANNARAFNTLERAIGGAAVSTSQMSAAQTRFRSAIATSKNELHGFTTAQKEAEAATKASDAAMLKQNNALEAARIKYLDMRAALEDMTGQESRIADLDSAFKDYAATMESGALSAAEFSDAQNAFRGGLAEINRRGPISDTVIAGLATRMTDLSKTAQVALGPLSGVASRITAITALAVRNTAAIATVIGSLVAYGAILGKAITAGSTYEQQMLRIESVLATTGNTAGFTASEIDAMARRIGDATLTTQGAVREAAVSLLTLDNINRDVMESALMAAQGMSLIARGDIQTNIRRVAKILEDPTANLRGLTEAGIQFNAVEETMIKRLQASGRLFEAQRIVLRKLEPLIEASKDEAGGLAGAWDTLGETITDTLQDFGTASDTIGALESGVRDLTSWLSNLLSNTQFVNDVTRSFTVTVNALISVARVLVSNLEFIIYTFGIWIALRATKWVLTLAGSIAGALVSAIQTAAASGAGFVGVLSGMGAAVTTFLSKIPLIGLAIGAAFIVNKVVDWVAGVNDAKQAAERATHALETHEEQVRAVGDAYRGAGGDIRQMAENLDDLTLLDISINLDALNDSIDNTKSNLADLSDEIFNYRRLGSSPFELPLDEGVMPNIPEEVDRVVRAISLSLDMLAEGTVQPIDTINWLREAIDGLLLDFDKEIPEGLKLQLQALTAELNTYMETLQAIGENQSLYEFVATSLGEVESVWSRIANGTMTATAPMEYYVNLLAELRDTYSEYDNNVRDAQDAQSALDAVTRALGKDLEKVLVDLGITAEEWARLNAIIADLDPITEYANSIREANSELRQNILIEQASGDAKIRLIALQRTWNAAIEMGIIKIGILGTTTLNTLQSLAGIFALFMQQATLEVQLDEVSGGGGGGSEDTTLDELRDKIALLEREIELSSETEYIRSNELALLEDQLRIQRELGTITSERALQELQMLQTIRELTLQTEHLAAVRDLEEEIQLQEQMFRNQWMYNEAREIANKLAEKAIELEQRYGNLLDERAVKEMELYRLTLLNARALEQNTSIIDKLYEGILSVAEAMLDAFIDGESAAEAFRNTVVNVLRDIAQELLRVALMQAFQMVLGLATGGVGSAIPAASTGISAGFGNVFPGKAMGGVLNANIPNLAMGNIINKPTLLRDHTSPRGLARGGEIGPEAVMPLVRDNAGRLGVSAQGHGKSFQYVDRRNFDLRGASVEAVARLEQALAEDRAALPYIIQQIIAGGL